MVHWIVDPQLESIDVFSLGPRGYERPVKHEITDRLVSAAVPRFEAALADVFRPA